MTPYRDQCPRCGRTVAMRLTKTGYEPYWHTVWQGSIGTEGGRYVTCQKKSK